MSDMNIAITNSVPLDRITESVKRSQVIEYPDQLGKRTIDTNSEEFEGKKVSDRLNTQKTGKDIPGEQQRPPLVPILQRDLDIKRVQLKSLERSFQHDLIDLDHPDVLKNWKDIPATDTYFYMLRPEKLANDKAFKIHQCKRMWCAKSMLRESFRSDNQTHRRRVTVKYSLAVYFINIVNKDPHSSDSINDAFEDMGRDESPIIATVLFPPPEVANEPSVCILAFF
ncbi:uncharacterized protein EV154DRAFT_488801 [Mucor mucedo]|uniref:uncharacterized protein n=1 Tax=Mucor mucedo TaxID=29922 RepID=UPI00221E6D28|nr:uncharacterized protein EV154DRAFT_488801 [Mucor mucedo]KAI7865048.1 hypothetical protein EV154DRAFT_488801 [Mucor mucedo]